MEFSVTKIACCESTQILARAAAQRGEAEGWGVCAARQEGGYGRRGSAWVSPEGSLYFSFVLRPDAPVEHLPELSLVVAEALRDACIELVGPDAELIQIKHPNDLIFVPAGEVPIEPFNKMSGIICERHAQAVCVGLGLNVNRPDDAHATCGDERNKPFYLSDFGLACDVDAARAAFESAFAVRYTAWLKRA